MFARVQIEAADSNDDLAQCQNMVIVFEMKLDLEQDSNLENLISN